MTFTNQRKCIKQDCIVILILQSTGFQIIKRFDEFHKPLQLECFLIRPTQKNMSILIGRETRNIFSISYFTCENMTALTFGGLGKRREKNQNKTANNKGKSQKNSKPHKQKLLNQIML